MEKRVLLRAVVFKSGDLWVGQCLEYDIAVQAKTPQEVPYELERAIVANVVIAGTEGLKPFVNIKPAPDRYFRMWERGMELKRRPEHHVFEIEGLLEPLPVPELRLSDLVTV